MKTHFFAHSHVLESQLKGCIKFAQRKPSNPITIVILQNYNQLTDISKRTAGTQVSQSVLIYLCTSARKQRKIHIWTKATLRTQCLRPRPRTQKHLRLRTALSRTDPLKAKNRNAQGRRLRTQFCKLSPKKERLSRRNRTFFTKF